MLFWCLTESFSFQVKSWMLVSRWPPDYDLSASVFYILEHSYDISLQVLQVLSLVLQSSKLQLIESILLTTPPSHFLGDILPLLLLSVMLTSYFPNCEVWYENCPSFVFDSFLPADWLFIHSSHDEMVREPVTVTPNVLCCVMTFFHFITVLLMFFIHAGPWLSDLAPALHVFPSLTWSLLCLTVFTALSLHCTKCILFAQSAF